jgi:putative Mn2+ efflux pump MntP
MAVLFDKVLDVSSDRAVVSRVQIVLGIASVVSYAFGYPLAIVGGYAVGWALVTLGGVLLIALGTVTVRRAHRAGPSS